MVLKLANELQLAYQRSDSKLSVGYVPTMGALHDGHLELVKRSKIENDITVVSIYVNPTQFNNKSDLKNYPRDLSSDINKLNSVDCDILFAPEDVEVYPSGKNILRLELKGLDKVLEGAFRPGHFDGVVTVVDRLFDMVKPNKAYFGEKDYQQLLIVQELARLRHPQIEIVPCKIVREINGLAMSSRNRRLNEAEKQLALKLYKSLTLVKDQLPEVGVSSAEQIGVRELEEDGGCEVEYLKIVNEHTLQEPKDHNIEPLRAFVAANVGPVRLIDNLKL